MSLASIYRFLALTSPKVEVLLRKLYWNNIRYLHKFQHSSNKEENREHNESQKKHIDFDKILDFLRQSGVQTSDTLVVHSSYGALSPSSLSSKEIIDKLISLVGPKGTLAMPAIREFPEEGIGVDYLLSYIDNEMKDIDTTYDIYRSKITSGLLPFTLMRYDDAEISWFPLNPLVAIGDKAIEIVRNNISGTLPSAHGPESSWARCAELDAWNIGIGVSEKDYLTMFHICQEDETWPVESKEWYFERNFTIKKGKKLQPIRIKERKHKWTKFFPEQNFYNDLKKAGILKHTIVDGVDVYISRAKEMVEFIKKQANPTYPYIIPRKYLRK